MAAIIGIALAGFVGYRIWVMGKKQESRPRAATQQGVYVNSRSKLLQPQDQVVRVIPAGFSGVAMTPQWEVTFKDGTRTLVFSKTPPYHL
jgi:hypothetical protein